MSTHCFAEVAMPVPLGRSFSYRVPPELVDRLVPGCRVLCELGRRKLAGVVLRIASEPPSIDASRLKSIVALLDSEPVLPAELLAFLGELARYYFAPIGAVLRLAVPAIEREQVRRLTEQGVLFGDEGLGRSRQVGGRRILNASATDRVEQAGSLRGQAAAVLALLRAEGERPVAQLVKRYGNARAALKKLEAAGLVQLERRVQPAPSLQQEAPARDTPPQLNEAQQAAVARIAEALDRDPQAAAVPSGSRAGPRAFLLFGITGSGKTEVYMQLIARCLEQDRGSLVLVPEIALTPQLVSRFRARLGDQVAVLHSGLPPAERHLMWQRLRAGELRVVVGARSALFAPVAALGLVVIDEEHDSSFKQEEGVRYHARDMALLRAHRAGAVAVLGSATPSLEAVALVHRKRLIRIDLPERATQASLPEVDIVDLKRFKAGPSGSRLLTLPLHRELERVLGAGEQAIIFLNRRGFAPAVVCEACGVAQSCQQCSVALTYHRRGGRLRCHYCDFNASMPRQCIECGRGELSLEGIGTEKLEATIAEAFPGTRVARMDRDVASGHRSAKLLARMRAGDIDVLVGTQMVTKGHDLPMVTLVGVVNADAALSMPDFRAAERGFQLLVQVAGRSGRHHRPGRVIIQTRNPEHPAVRFASHHDVTGFLEQELRDRVEVGYPPFSRMALLRVDGSDEQRARQAATELATAARACPAARSGAVQVLGPAPAPIARLRGRYRFRVLLRCRQRAPLRQVLAAVEPRIGELPRALRAVIDVDPVSML